MDPLIKAVHLNPQPSKSMAKWLFESLKTTKNGVMIRFFWSKTVLEALMMVLQKIVTNHYRSPYQGRSFEPSTIEIHGQMTVVELENHKKWCRD